MGAVAFGITEFKVLDVLESTDRRSLKYIIEGRDKPITCCTCGVAGYLNVHGNKKRLIQDLPLVGKLVYLELAERRYICSNCGHTFVEHFDSVDNRQFTKRLRTEIVRRVLHRETFTRIANDYSIADKTVRRLFDEWTDDHAYMLRYDTPEVMGLDEAHIDDKFRLVVTDNKNKILLDMLPNNKPATVLKFLRDLPDKGKVKAVTMDFFEGYANGVQKSFYPYKPLIVIDKFHVVQLLNRRMDAVRKRVHKEEKEKCVGTARRLKNERKLFMSNIEDLDNESLDKVSEWMKSYPVLEEAYVLKEMFREIYDLPERGFAAEAFDRWCNSIPDTLPEFLTLRDTFTSRREHILNYFDYRVTNAFAESSNNIIKSIEKQGKGYDFDTLRKIALFSSRMEEFQKFDSKNAEYIKSWQF